MVARFVPEKDHLNFIRAIHLFKKKYSKFICVLAGLGTDTSNEKIKKLLLKYDLSNEFLLLGTKNISEIMNFFDLHVLSSKTEGFPNVIGEAMSCGIPCISTNVGDSALIIKDTGWVVPPKNPLALSKAISQAINLKRDSKSWNKKKKAAREQIKSNFTIDKMVNSYHRVWNTNNMTQRQK